MKPERTEENLKCRPGEKQGSGKNGMDVIEK